MSMLAKPEVLALDLDLTLHDVIKHYDHSINATLAHFGRSALTPEELNSLGDNFVNTKMMLTPLVPVGLVDEAFEYYINHFLGREIPINSLLPGAKEMLALVQRELKIPIIGITNSEEDIAQKILSDLGVAQYFDHVIGIKDDHLPKPHTQMLIKALDIVSIKAGPHVWFMGDRHTDTECAKSAGCTAIRFYHINKPVDENADLFINCHLNLFAMMKAKCGNVS